MSKSKIPIELLEQVDVNTLQLFIKIMEWYINETADLNSNLEKIHLDFSTGFQTMNGNLEQLKDYFTKEDGGFNKKLTTMANKMWIKVLATIGGLTLTGLFGWILSLALGVKL